MDGRAGRRTVGPADGWPGARTDGRAGGQRIVRGDGLAGERADGQPVGRSVCRACVRKFGRADGRSVTQTQYAHFPIYAPKQHSFMGQQQSAYGAPRGAAMMDYIHIHIHVDTHVCTYLYT